MNKLQADIKELLEFDPYTIDSDLKKNKLINILKQQIIHHIKNCDKYKRWYKSNNFISPHQIKDYEEIPFIPSGAFKLTNLISAENSKKIQSSGTTSNNKSTIFIDKATSLNQTKSLSKILSSILGKKRMHYYIVDLEPQIKSRDNTMSARQAGMAGYLMGAKTKTYLLKLDQNENIVVDKDKIKKLISNSLDHPILILGYTYMLYEYFLENLSVDFKKIKMHKETKLIHFGGWKKLKDRNILKNHLIAKINQKLNIQINNIFDIYGFTEQLGTVYVSSGNSGCKISSYSHVIVRDPKTFEVLENGKVGFLQFLSPLPLSYPGFSILNDDLGKISLISNKKYNYKFLEFEINPRLDNAENRGCGDTLPDNYYI